MQLFRPNLLSNLTIQLICLLFLHMQSYNADNSTSINTYIKTTTTKSKIQSKCKLFSLKKNKTDWFLKS
jgi:hypothetical protein